MAHFVLASELLGGTDKWNQSAAHARAERISQRETNWNRTTPIDYREPNGNEVIDVEDYSAATLTREDESRRELEIASRGSLLCRRNNICSNCSHVDGR
jgi:hypothetical protein